VALEEIEACLRRHPDIAEAAVVARPDPIAGVRLETLYVTHAGAPLAQVELRQFCAATLPSYMLPDRFVHRPGLPRTPGGKVDLQALQREAG